MSTRSETSRTRLSHPATRRSARRSTATTWLDPRSLDLDDDVGQARCRRRRHPRASHGALDRGMPPPAESGRRTRRRARAARPARPRRARGSPGRHGRHLVLKPFELLRDLGRQHVESRRHELADLDHEAAEVDRQHVEVLRDALQPRGAVPRREPTRVPSRGRNSSNHHACTMYRAANRMILR